ncbi:hypothetical protein WDZ92_27455 [Nostoc sp. NIES-2111]
MHSEFPDRLLKLFSREWLYEVADRPAQDNRETCRGCRADNQDGHVTMKGTDALQQQIRPAVGQSEV